MSKNNKFKRYFILFISLFILLNIGILVFNKTYLYKGLQSTYLKGRTGPGIYDSIIFPIRVAHASNLPEKWETHIPTKELSQEAKNLLNETNTTSFLIVENGEIIHESYYGDHDVYTKSNSFSMAKSFIALMIGVAIDRKEIHGFDDLINDYLPFVLENSEKVTIRDLLGMSSGLKWSESGINPFSDNAEAYYTSDLVSMVKDLKFIDQPGEAFEYKSGNSQILGFILEKATGMHPAAYFEKYIWSEIGAENDLLWSLDHVDGVEKTFCCAYATTRDYAKIGQLILNQGTWNGSLVIESATLNEIITAYNESTSHYGLHFWIYEHSKHPSVYLRGILGQYIIVVPSLNVVMVRTGHKRKGKYSTTDAQSDVSSTDKNDYKQHHPLDLFDYFSILNEVLNK